VDPNFKRLKGIPLKFSQAIAILYITIYMVVGAWHEKFTGIHCPEFEGKL